MPEAGPGVLLQVCANDHPPFAHICQYYEAAARHLGWQPVTVMLGPPTAEPVDGFHYLSTAGPGATTAAFAAALDRLLGRRGPLLTLCHRYRAYRLAVHHRPGGGPLVAVAHEFGFLRRRRRRLQIPWDRLRGRAPVTFAGVSDAVTAELAGAVDAPVLLPNGLDLVRADAMQQPRDAARRALGIDADAFAVGVVGRLHPKKRPDLALEGFRLAVTAMPRARLVLVGDGELAAELGRRAAGLPVSLPGFVADAPRLMKAFDLLVMPSGDREAFGMVALEAMAAGVPVLCGPAAGPRFVIGDAGRVFAPDTPGGLADALIRAYEDAGTGALGRLAGAARQRVETTFSVPAAGRRLAALAAQ